MGLFRRAFSLLSGNSKKSDSEELVNGAFKMFGTFNVAVAVLPIALVVFIGIILFLVYAYIMNMFQLSDPNSRSGGSVQGVATYSEEDLKACVQSTSSATIANSYDEFVSKWSGGADSFNNFVKDSVDKAGCGTGQGVATAGLSLSCGYTKETNYKLFYYCEDMGSLNCNSTDVYMEGVQPGIRLDCRGFVFWSLYNGGFKWPENGAVSHNSEFLVWADNKGYYLSDYTAGKPGDIVTKTGHILLIVGTYDGGYYTAEEYGYGNGLVVITRSYDDISSSGYRIVDMSKYYSDPENKRTDRCG